MRFFATLLYIHNGGVHKEPYLAYVHSGGAHKETYVAYVHHDVEKYRKYPK